MAAKAELVVKATGVDATGGMFKQIRGNIAKVGSSVAAAVKGVGVVGAAVIGTGFAAYKALSSVTSGMNEVANAAHRAGEGSAASFQRLVDTLGVAGLKVSAESLVSSFRRMRKETGRVGITGFVQTLDEISRLETEQERLTQLTKIFGEAAGPEFAGLVASGVGNLGTLIRDAMGAVGGATDDAFKKAQTLQAGFDIVGTNIKAGWQQAVLSMLDLGDASSDEIMAKAIEVGATIKYVIGATGVYVKDTISLIWDSFQWVAKWIAKTVFGLVQVINAAVAKCAQVIGYVWGLISGQDPSEVGERWGSAISDSMLGTFLDSIQGELDDAYGELFAQNWDTSKLRAEMEQTKATAAKTAKAINRLSEAAQAGNSNFAEAGESIGSEAAKTFKDEMKNPGWIEAGSNELAKILNGQWKTPKAPVAETANKTQPPTVNVEPAIKVQQPPTANKLPSETSREKQVSSILERAGKFIEQLVEVQKGGWDRFNKFSEGLEAI